MKNRAYYEKKFASYPDLVTTKQARIMLGRIGKSTVYYLLQNHHLEYFFVRCTYMIPKSVIIDYIMGDHYRLFKKKLRHQV